MATAIHGFHIRSSRFNRYVSRRHSSETGEELLELYPGIAFEDWPKTLMVLRVRVGSLSSRSDPNAPRAFSTDFWVVSADGLIDENEFVTVCANYGIDAAECKLAFSKFSNVRIIFLRGIARIRNSPEEACNAFQNNAVAVTKAEFAKLWKEFFTSDDVSARGNFIFGKTEFD